MLSKKEFLDMMSGQFPRWMDINKRRQTSSGGKLLQSFIDSIHSIEYEINEYKKFFFIENHLDKCASTIDYVYVCEIGDIKDYEVFIFNPYFDVTEDIRKFHKEDNYALLYENRTILIKKNAYENLKKIEYQINGLNYSAQAMLVSIWNIYDEFATFAGIKRLHGENNKALLERTYNAYKNRTDSTKEGLINSVYNVLSQIDPIDKDEIIIEQPDDENIHLKDSNGISIIDVMQKVNKDIYKEKVWSADKWTHDFKKQERMPIEWDTEIKDRLDGTGQGNNLKTFVSKELYVDEPIDIFIQLYKKHLETAKAYSRKNNKTIDINLNLKKYNNILNKINIDYKILAAYLDKVNVHSSHIEFYKESFGKNKIYIEDIIKDFNPKITVADNSKLEEEGEYLLEFRPTSEYGNMTISKAVLGETNLLKEEIIDGYVFNRGEEIYNSNVKFYGSIINDFNDYENMENSGQGMRIKDRTKPGIIAVNIDDEMINKYVYVNTEIEERNMLGMGIVEYEGFEEIDFGELFSGNKVDSGFIEVNTTATSFSLLFEYGNADIEIFADGETIFDERVVEAKEFKYNFDKRKNLTIRIVKIPGNIDNAIKVRDLMFSDFKIEKYTEKNEIISSTSFGDIIQGSIEGKMLYIKITPIAGSNPYIKSVHIGKKLNPQTDRYIIDGIQVNDVEFDKFNIETECKVLLYKKDEEGNNILINDDYTTRKEYINNTIYPEYIEVDDLKLAKYNIIFKNIDLRLKEGKMVKTVLIRPNSSLSYIEEEGYNKTFIRKENLDKYINRDYELFSNKIHTSVIKKKNSSESKEFYINRNQFPRNANLFVFSMSDSNISPCFVINSSNNISKISDSINHNFDKMYFISKEGKEYVSFNTDSVMREYTDNIDMVNNFDGLNTSRNVIYLMDNKNENIDISFNGINKFTTNFRDKVHIKINNDLMKQNYKTTSFRISNNFDLSDYIVLDEYIQAFGERMDLSDFIITCDNEDIEIMYKNSSISMFEQLIVKNDGFTKLKKSNIYNVRVFGVFPENNYMTVELEEGKDYELLDKEGIIKWTNDEHYGKNIDIVYSYKIPNLLKLGIDLIYETLEYKKEAYIKDERLEFKNIYQDIFIIPDREYEKLLAADNYNIESNIKSNVVNIVDQLVVVNKVLNPDSILVSPGYYYKDGLEYYKFVRMADDYIKVNKEIEMYNVQKKFDNIETFIESSNFVKNSSFYSSNTGRVSKIDFSKENNIKGISNFRHLTSMNNMLGWNTFEMDTAITQGLNDNGIKFTPRNDMSYAYIEISDYVDKYNSKISAYVDGKAELYLFKNKKFSEVENNMEVLQLELIKKFYMNKKYQHVNIDYENDTRYFILIKGEAIVDDIIISDSEHYPDMHIKEMNYLGFNIKDNDNNKDIILKFDQTGLIKENIEISRDNNVSLSSSIKYGLNNIYSINNNFSSIITKNVQIVKDVYIENVTNSGYVETNSIKIDNHKSINKVLVTVNDVAFDKLKDFDISIEGAYSTNEDYTHVKTEKSTNYLVSDFAYPYLKIKINGNANRIINSINVAVEYKETADIIRPRENINGKIITKIYDINKETSFIFRDIKTDRNIGDNNIYIRGIKSENNRSVITEWKRLDKKNPFVFENYRYIQFMIELNKSSEIKIDSFELEVY